MNIFKKRREQLLNKLPANCAAIFFAGNEIQKSEDEAYPFDVNRNFYYLTGLNQAEHILVLTKFNNIIKEKLFILPYSEFYAKWIGNRLKPEEAKDITAIDDICEVEEFNDYLAGIYNHARPIDDFPIYLDLWKYTKHQTDSCAFTLAKKIQDNYPSLLIKDVYATIVKLRMIKSDEEIEEIKKANAITAKGIEAMMSIAKADINEMEMEGCFLYTLMKNGCKDTAFNTIAAGGKNATVLHYSENNQAVKENDLFLCDLGATSNYYCADVSRTFPINGKFTARQKEIYNCVLQAQKIVEENAKIGMTLRDLNKLVIEHYTKELPKLNLNKPVQEYYFHGVSHLLGLDTHDVTLDHANYPLEKGMVFTNEPGLYISDEGIGIRIEDDLLMTDEGTVNLTCAIKSIDDIEKFMKK